MTIRYQESNNDLEKKVELQVVDEGENGYRVLSKGLEQLLNRRTYAEITDTRIFEDYDRCD